MKVNPKITGGLAWVGLAVILGVPSADILFGRTDGNIAMTSGIEAVRPQVTDPVETAAAVDPVNSYLEKNKELPSHISNTPAPAPQPVALKPIQPVEEPAATSAAPQLAVVQPESEAPPVPLPRDMRPKVQTASVAPATVQSPAPAVTRAPAIPAAPKVSALPDPAPVIVEERRPAEPAKLQPFPLAEPEAMSAERQPPVISGDRLEEWDSGSLADYLARKGLLGDDEAPMRQQRASDGYAADGFNFEESPNRRGRIRRNNDDFFLF